MKTKLTLAAFVIFLFAISCRKDSNCSKGTVTINNLSGTVIHFSYLKNTAYNDSILPGASTVTYVSSVKNHIWGSKWPSLEFYSDHGDYIFSIKKCEQEENIN